MNICLLQYSHVISVLLYVIGLLFYQKRYKLEKVISSVFRNRFKLCTIFSELFSNEISTESKLRGAIIEEDINKEHFEVNVLWASKSSRRWRPFWLELSFPPFPDNP